MLWKLSSRGTRDAASLFHWSSWNLPVAPTPGRTRPFVCSQELSPAGADPWQAALGTAVKQINSDNTNEGKVRSGIVSVCRSCPLTWVDVASLGMDEPGDEGSLSAPVFFALAM